MLHSLLHGDIAGAFRANALLVISLPFLLFLIWIEIYRTKYPSLYRKIHSLSLIITVSAILIAWLIIRNIFNI